MPVIDRFNGPHRFLSNFETAYVLLDGEPYWTVEHAYQAAKTLDKRERLWLAGLRTPGQAKRRGRKLALRPDWEQVKDTIMLDLLRQKFRQPQLRDALLATGDAELIEGNTWGDTYWGCVQRRGAEQARQDADAGAERAAFLGTRRQREETHRLDCGRRHVRAATHRYRRNGRSVTPCPVSSMARATDL